MNELNSTNRNGFESNVFLHDFELFISHRYLFNNINGTKYIRNLGVSKIPISSVQSTHTHARTYTHTNAYL